MALRDYIGIPVAAPRLDVLAAGVVFLLALVLFPLRFYVSQFFIYTVPIVIGVASGGYLLLRRFDFDGTASHRWRLGRGTGHVLRMAVLVGLAAMVFVGTATGGRTVPFFAVAGAVGSLVFLQILLLRESALDPVPILLQVVAFAVVVRFTALLTTPGLIGVDAWVHLPVYADSIRSTGTLWAIADSKYFAAPLYHLLVVVAADALGASLRTGLYATLAVVMPLSVLLVYYTGQLVFPLRWALFATATFSVADHVVRWGIHVIPTSMGLVFFLAVFYGVTKLYTGRSTLGGYVLVALFAVATILTHQISTFIVLLFLGVGTAIQVYARLADWGLAPGRIVGAGAVVGADGGPASAEAGPANTDGGSVDADSGSVRSSGGAGSIGARSVNFAGLFAVVLPLTLLNWSYAPMTGPSFLMGMMDSSSSSLSSAALLALESAKAVDTAAIESVLVSTPFHVQLFDALGFLLLLFVSLVGSFTLLRYRARELLPLSWLSVSGVLLFVVMGLPLFGLYFLIPMRWYAFLYVPLAMLAAYGARYLDATMPTRGLVAVLVVFSLLYPGAMLVNHKATHDDPVADEYYSQFAYTESELAAADTISQLHPTGATLQADHPYFLYFRKAKGMTPAPLNLTADGEVDGSHVVYRRHQTRNGLKAEYRGEMFRVQLERETVCRPSMDVLYSNGDVRYCRGATAG